MSKKGSIVQCNFFIHHSLLVFDNLNNLYKRLSVLALEQQTSVNSTGIGTSNTLQSISSNTTTMSRHGSIFYDAPEALSVLLLNEDKDEIEKMVRSTLLYSSLTSLLSFFLVRFRVFKLWR